MLKAAIVDEYATFQVQEFESLGCRTLTQCLHHSVTCTPFRVLVFQQRQFREKTNYYPAQERSKV